ncbi:uncharacterized protein [Choristoneura fumiferana]|uniref:uncharacterized protein n=1 Tax=Choristoneura fumiferana TaxID=7141 RepID=UPI003D15536D
MSRHLHTEFLQTNINHSARAQDLLMQVLAEWKIGVAVVAEPYLIPPRKTGWGHGGLSRRGGAVNGPQRLSLRERGAGYVAANWGGIVLVGVYFSPNRSLLEFERFLDGLEPVVQRALPPRSS